MIDIDKLIRHVNTNEFIVGVSGGVDSICLLDILIKNKNQLPKFKAVHVNHKISKNSDYWEHWVKNHCDNYGVECITQKVDLKKSGNLEQSARIARYEIFTNQAEKIILLAHHKNDQFETFFIQLHRGAGLKGLKGMTYCCPSWNNPNQQIIRPLLSVTKSQMIEYATNHNLSWIEDESNIDNTYDRNWIRNVLTPLFNNRFSNFLNNTILSMNNIDNARQLCTDLAEIDIKNVVVDNYILWNKLIELSEIRIKNIIFHIIEKHDEINFSGKQVNAFCQSLKNSDINGKNEMICGKLRFHKIGKKIFFNK